MKAALDSTKKQYLSKVTNPRSRINTKLDKIFSMATLQNTTDDILQKGYYRTLIGNPPRKNNRSFGDAIIWEQVLALNTNEDLVIISGDGDFECERECGKLHEFLRFEWAERTSNKIELYTTIGEYINSLTSKTKISQAEISKEKQANIASQYLDSLIGFPASVSGIQMQTQNQLSCLYDAQSQITQSLNPMFSALKLVQDQYSGVGSSLLSTLSTPISVHRCERCCCDISHDYLSLDNKCTSCQSYKQCSECGKEYYQGALDLHSDTKCPNCRNLLTNLKVDKN